jgi:hypothetical protein
VDYLTLTGAALSARGSTTTEVERVFSDADYTVLTVSTPNVLMIPR